MSAADFTPQERADLALAAPELAGCSREELALLMARYPTDERLRALREGRPTAGSLADAAAAVRDDPALHLRYPSMFGGAGGAGCGEEADPAMRARYPSMFSR
jgi:hypothetical protein